MAPRTTAEQARGKDSAVVQNKNVSGAQMSREITKGLVMKHARVAFKYQHSRGRAVGKWFLGELKTLAARHAHDMTNVRGLGLMCAFDLPNQTARDDAVRRLQEERVLVLGCGERSIRFVPALNVTMPELDFGLVALDRVLS